LVVRDQGQRRPAAPARAGGNRLATDETAGRIPGEVMVHASFAATTVKHLASHPFQDAVVVPHCKPQTGFAGLRFHGRRRIQPRRSASELYYRALTMRRTPICRWWARCAAGFFVGIHLLAELAPANAQANPERPNAPPGKATVHDTKSLAALVRQS